MTLAKPSNLFVRFSPETGSIVPGVLNRVYFEALANYEGTEVAEVKDAVLNLVNLRDNSKKVVLTGISTSHVGRGVISFIPEEMAPEYVYQLQINPKGISKW